MISLQMTAELRGVQISEGNRAVIDKYFDLEHEQFIKACAVVHRKSVFQILTRLIRLCNVLTGRLRGSWLPFMQRYGYQGANSFLSSRPLDGGGQKGSDFSEAAVHEGMNQGDFIDDVLNTTIISNVVYAEAVNNRSNFVGKALAWGDTKYNDNFRRFFEVAEKKGWIEVPDINAPADED